MKFKSNMISRANIFVESLYLFGFSIFLILAPYSKQTVKTVFVFSITVFFLNKIFQFGKNFYLQLLPKTAVNPVLVYFTFFVIASTLFSLDIYYSQSVLFERYIGYLLFFLLGIDVVRKRKDALILGAAVVLSMVFLGIGGIWDVLHDPGQYERLSTAYGNSTNYVAYLALFLPLTVLFSFFARKKYLKFGGIIGALFLLPCFILQGSRTLWLAAPISIFVLLLFRNRNFAFYFLAFLITVFLCKGILFKGVFPLPHSIQQRTDAIFDPCQWWGTRIEFWKAGLAMLGDHPLFGVGLGMYGKMFSVYSPNFGSENLHAESLYVEIAAEMGLLGMVSFLSVFIVYLKKSIQSLGKIQDQDVYSMQAGLIGGIIASLILGCSTSIITVGVQNSPLFWFLFGMSVGLIPKEEKNSSMATG